MLIANKDELIRLLGKVLSDTVDRINAADPAEVLGKLALSGTPRGCPLTSTDKAALAVAKIHFNLEDPIEDGKNALSAVLLCASEVIKE